MEMVFIPKQSVMNPFAKANMIPTPATGAHQVKEESTRNVYANASETY